jgi:membrane-bound serine protease (ClpP class)
MITRGVMTFKRFVRFVSESKRQNCAAGILFTAVAVVFVMMYAGAPTISAADEHAAPLVVELKLNEMVEPILATYVSEGITDAAQRHASLVLITMDTPGGLSDSMTDIIHHILESPVPVVVYVAPVGARGASAGFYILLSADVAAMAPGTHTGASTPVLMPAFISMPVDEVMRKKINNDATAFLRSFSEKRGRNPKLAETAVTDARAFTEKEALDGHMIDLIANDRDDLLKQLNGREITRFDGKTQKLSLQGYTVADFELSVRQKFLSRIVQPDIFFLLLMVGVLGLYTEFNHPGMVAPGVIGGICAVLALYAMHLLPVNFAGVLLIVLALALFVLEAKLASHGVLLVGGVVSMFLGAMFLIRSPLTPAGVSVGVALAVTIPFAFLTVFLMRLVLRSRRWKVSTGKEEMLGEEAIVTSALAAGGEGMVRIHGELWRAGSSVAIANGQAVRVIRIDGLKLIVEPVETPATASR